MFFVPLFLIPVVFSFLLFLCFFYSYIFFYFFVFQSFVPNSALAPTSCFIFYVFMQYGISLIWKPHSSISNSIIQNFPLQRVPPLFPISFLHFKRGLKPLPHILLVPPKHKNTKFADIFSFGSCA
jgi:hypothetical protein